MFILDSLMIAGLRWTLNTIATAADAELDDEASLREQLLAAVMQLQAGEIDDAAFQEIERDLLARMRAAREQRHGGQDPIALTAGAPLGGDAETTLAVEASLAGDFHDPPATAVEPPSPVMSVAPRRAPSRPRQAAGRPARRRTPLPIEPAGRARRGAPRRRP